MEVHPFKCNLSNLVRLSQNKGKRRARLKLELELSGGEYLPSRLVALGERRDGEVGSQVGR